MILILPGTVCFRSLAQCSGHRLKAEAVHNDGIYPQLYGIE